MILGDAQVAFTAFRGTLEMLVPVICASATDSKDVYEAVMMSARMLNGVRKQGFDFEAVHEGRSSAAEQFAKINKKEKGKKN